MRRFFFWSAFVGVAIGGAEARGELAAHWKFEAGAPFEDAVSRMDLHAEFFGEPPPEMFKVSPGKAPRLTEGNASLISPDAKGVDLRLSVNAPTRGSNPFRLLGNSWTLTGWFQHSGAKPSAFGSTLAGTHGYSKLEGRGFAGWSLRVIEVSEGEFNLAAVFSSGGAEDVKFELISADAIETGEGKWNFFGLTWKHDGAGAGRGEARLWVNAKAAGMVKAPADFDLAEADRNAFRGIWIAGRPTAKKGGGSDNWAGRLDEVKFYTDTVADEAMLVAENGPVAPEVEPERESVAVVKGEPDAAEPEPVAEVKKNPVVPEAKPEPEPVAEVKKEPVMPEAKPEPEPVAEVKKEPVVPEAKPEPEPEPVAEVKKEPVTPAAEPEPVAVVKEEPVTPEAESEKILAARTWTDLRGQKLEAALVVPATPDEGRVLLQTTDGIRLSLPVERLSEADRDFVAGNR